VDKLESLIASFSGGNIGRREFITRVTALGAAAMLPAFFSATPANAAPKKGGRLRIGCGGSSLTDTLDPANVTDIMAPLVSFGLVRSCLVGTDEESQLAPELAVSWEAKPGAKVWKFNLRKGVEFHNGQSFTSEDVIASINHHRGEDSKSIFKSLAKQIVDVKTDGKYSVIFTLEAGNADFPYALSDQHVSIFPAGTTDFSKGVGTGPYILEEWEPGVKALTKRNPNYFKSDCAYFDEVEVIAINDVTARTNALRSGQVDIINRCERKTFHLLEKLSTIQPVIQNGMRHYTFCMRCDMAPFNDVNLRLAMKHAIDRDSIVKTILRGYGEVGNDHPISKLNKYYNKSLPQRQYDPEKVKFYLKKAGMDTFSTSINIANVAFEGAVDAAILYKEHASKAGINLNVVQEPNDGYWSNAWMKKPFTGAYWSGRPTEDWMFSDAYAEGAAWNETYWSNKRFNDLLKAGRAELDEKKRAEIYGEMQQLVRDDCGEIIMAFSADLHAASTKLQKPEKVAANWEFDGFKIGERWSFA
jgi:peptide/nickel transport system substrate-binding protein